jgi:hypothetical protein
MSETHPADPLPGDLRDPNADVIGNPDVVVLVGYLGDGRDGKMRIYRDPELNHYVEFPEASIHRRETIDKPDEFGARSAVWVDRATMTEDLGLGDAVQQALADKGVGTRVPRTLLDAAQDMNILCRPMTKSRCAAT